MRIAVDVTPMKVDGSVGGLMNLCVELIEGLSNEENIQLVLLCAYWNKEFLKKYISKDVSLIEVIKKDASTNRFYKLFKKVYNRVIRYKGTGGMLKGKEIDILFCPFSATTYKENGIPTVSTINDIQHEYYPQFFTPLENHHRTQFYKDTSKKVEGVICISDYTKKTFCEKYNFDLDRAYTVYIAIQNRFKREDKTIIEKLKLNGIKYIVYPANFWEHKNHKILLNAFSMYAHRNLTAKLVLTGNALGKEKEYEEIFEKMGLKNRVIITGYLNNEEFYSILKNSKGLIFPSLFEGFGIPIVEAMYINKLISCSNVTSLPEVGCESICYFNPTKPDEVLKGIEYLFESEVTENIIEDYRIQLERFNFKKMINNYVDVFQKVISNKTKVAFMDKCEGIYPDKWSGQNIQIQCAGKNGSKLRVNITLPKFVNNSLKFSTFLESKEESYIIKPGQTLDLNWEVTSDEWALEFSVKKTWMPSIVLQSDDKRELGFMINELELVTKDNVEKLIF